MVRAKKTALKSKSKHHLEYFTKQPDLDNSKLYLLRKQILQLAYDMVEKNPTKIKFNVIQCLTESIILR